MVWPGSHKFFKAYFERIGHNVLVGVMPVMVTESAGDVALAHYFVLHGACPNSADDIRHTLITRLRHSDIESTDLDTAYIDIWPECPGVLISV